MKKISLLLILFLSLFFFKCDLDLDITPEPEERLRVTNIEGILINRETQEPIPYETVELRWHTGDRWDMYHGDWNYRYYMTRVDGKFNFTHTCDYYPRTNNIKHGIWLVGSEKLVTNYKAPVLVDGVTNNAFFNREEYGGIELEEKNADYTYDLKIELTPKE